VRVVLDTNVLVSALMNLDSHCGRILTMVFEGEVEPCVDARILAEYEDVLPRPKFGFDPKDVEDTLQVMYSSAEAVTPQPLSVRLPHTDDVPFLETAHHAGAILVTRNLRDFPPKQRAGVTVLTPEEFLDLLSRQG
jgi:putative PIN family toxin of toxin-antitoxin system